MTTPRPATGSPLVDTLAEVADLRAHATTDEQIAWASARWQATIADARRANAERAAAEAAPAPRQFGTRRVPAGQVVPGDVIVTFAPDGGPNRRRQVVDVDRHTNRHGLVIIRTSYRPGGDDVGSLVAAPDRLVTVERVDPA